MKAESLGHVDSLALHGLAGKVTSDVAFTRSLYGGSACEASDIRAVSEAIRRRGYPRSEVVAALKAQNESWSCSVQTRESLRRLENGAFCVMTGQQAGILTGPLYTVYKALTAVAWAREMESLLGEPVVPVFWIAGDDHDFAEAASVSFPSANGSPRAITLPRALVRGADAARVANLSFGSDIAGWVRSTLSLLPEGPGKTSVAEAVETAFLPGRTVVDAFATLLTRWIGEFGLILVSPADGALKSLMAPVFAQEIADPVGSRNVIDGQNSVIRGYGYAPHVTLPPEATLLFLDDDSGNRRRVDYSPESGFHWREGGESREIPDLSGLAEASPERLSPNVLLRPVAGDHLFPTIVHVMGPGEIAYMAQARPVYEAHGIPMPLVAARARFTLAPEEIEDWLGARSLGIADALQPTDVWRHTLGEREKSRALGGSADECREALDAAYERLAAVVRSGTPGMDTAVLSARIKTQGLMNKLERKLDQRFRRLVRERMPELEQVSGFVYPSGIPQERVYSVAPFISRYGESFFPELLSRIRPFEPVHVCLWTDPFGLNDLPLR